VSLPLLTTKLFIPPVRAGLTLRPRLLARLDEGLTAGRLLTLVSAPAGSGKTSLLSAWAAGCGRRAAWLSLDEGDNDPARFLMYLAAALQGVCPGLGSGVLGLLQTAQPPLEAVLTSLLNEIAAQPEAVLLVLDDYHLLESKAVDQILIFMLGHLPPQLHLVIATREDPALPLTRLRARGQLNEVRADHLSFNLEEAADFLTRGMGLTLSPVEVAALETRTEGWIAGLQLAALSMQGQTEPARFIKTFTGSHRFVMDYLMEEVLQRQPPSIQRFLLGTAVLERLCGPLCEALLDAPPGSGQETLENLERANLFILPLDNERRWYRYHHLFVDLLRQRLAAGPELAGLHGRASLWFEEAGEPAAAFKHAAAAKDWARAARLAELSWTEMDASFQSRTWLGWVRQIPEAVLHARPVLSTQLAWALLDNGELEAAEGRLRQVETSLETPEGPPEVVDQLYFQALPSRIANARAYRAQIAGEMAEAERFAKLALQLAPPDDLLGRAQAMINLEFSQWTSGNLEGAAQAMRNWVESMRQAGNVFFEVASTFALADILVALGRLHQAIELYQHTLQLAARSGPEVEQITAHHQLGLALLYHELGQAEESARHLELARQRGEQTSLVDWPCRWRVAQAQLLESGGAFEGALTLLEEAQSLYVRVPVPDLRPFEALKARVYLRQGQRVKAQAWAKQRGLSARDALSYLTEFEHLVLARLMAAGDGPERLEAAGLLDRLRQAAEAQNRPGSLLEIRITQVVVHQALGELPQALATLEAALTLAEPEGYVRSFLDEGPLMLGLLGRVKPNEARIKAYAAQLLAAGGSAAPASTPRPRPQALVEPLSEREIEILKLLAKGLSNAEIGERLYLALSTVKGHNQRIFGKLGVQSRTEAIVRGRELNLI
jgi:LuxR family maltose regulon positive regulatory protein